MKFKTCPYYGWALYRILFPCEIHGRWNTYQSFTTSSTIFTLGTRHPELVELVFPNRTWRIARLKSAIVVPHKLHGFANGILQWPLDKMYSHVQGSEVTLYSDADGAAWHAWKAYWKKVRRIVSHNSDFMSYDGRSQSLYINCPYGNITLLEDSSESLGSPLCNDDSSGERDGVWRSHHLECDRWSVSYAEKNKWCCITLVQGQNTVHPSLFQKGTENRFIQTSQAPMKRVEQ